MALSGTEADVINCVARLRLASQPLRSVAKGALVAASADESKK